MLFQPTVTLRLNCCRGNHKTGEIITAVDDNTIVDWEKNELSVPKEPTNAWCEQREGTKEFVMIPVYCKKCNAWTIHWYSSVVGGGTWQTVEPHSYKRSLHFMYRSSTDECISTKLNQPVSDLMNVSAGGFEYLFATNPKDNWFILQTYQTLLRHFCVYATSIWPRWALEKWIRDEESRRFPKSLEMLQKNDRQIVDYQALSNVVFECVVELHRLQGSIQSPTIAEVRKRLQTVLVKADGGFVTQLSMANVPFVSATPVQVVKLPAEQADEK
ncbi:MAG: hypothetical protein WCV85_01430 [Patescibacteria group bacterium]|jgi:hypothetical protein